MYSCWFLGRVLMKVEPNNRKLFHFLAGGKIPKLAFVFLNEWAQCITHDGGLTVMVVIQAQFVRVW